MKVRKKWQSKEEYQQARLRKLPVAALDFDSWWSRYCYSQHDHNEDPTQGLLDLPLAAYLHKRIFRKLLGKMERILYKHKRMFMVRGLGTAIPRKVYRYISTIRLRKNH